LSLDIAATGLVYACLKHWAKVSVEQLTWVWQLFSAFIKLTFPSRLHNEYHLFVPTEINLYLATTKSQDLMLNSGGSLPIYVHCQTSSKAQSHKLAGPLTMERIVSQGGARKSP
jgi:hypothetical protein